VSGRHTMPPAGRRKAAADSGESPEQTSVEETSAEEVTVEETSVEEASTEEASATEASVEEPAEAVAAVEKESAAEEPAEAEQKPARSRVSLLFVLSAIALVLTSAAAAFRWLIVSNHESEMARAESVQAARDITVEMLSYQPETVEQQLSGVRDKLTGEFLGKYTAMINEVIPAAQAQQIAAVAEVPRIGSVSATPSGAELVLFVNQTVAVGDHAPQRTESVMRATMVKDGDRWLMAEYEPVQP
jgi:Mce-associated membrane protein